VGGSRSFPCLPDDVEQPYSTDKNSAKRPSKLKANYNSVQMAWCDEHGVEVASKSDVETIRVYVNSHKNLTLKNAQTENTGRYQCVATATVANNSKITVVNVLRINGQTLTSVITVINK